MGDGMDRLDGTVVARVRDALLRGGVEAVFSVPGDGNMVFDYAIVGSGTRYRRAVREDGAVMMALGFMRRTGRLAVASVTLGPGLTNTITALTTAVRAGSPVVVVAGATRDVRHLQYAAQPDMLRSTGALVVAVDDIATVEQTVGEVLLRSRRSRVPVVLLLHMEDQLEATAEVSAAEDVNTEIVGDTPDEVQLDRALGILATARRPIVLAGKGVLESGSEAEVAALTRVMGAVMATTLGAHGLTFDGVPHLGIFGGLGSEWGVQVISAADCVVALGASLNGFTTADGSLLQGKAVVAVDHDPMAFDRNDVDYQATIVGDVSTIVTVFLQQLREAGLADRRPSWTQRPDGDDLSEESDPEAPTNMRSALRVLDRLIPEQRTVVVDGGRFYSVPVHELRVPDARSFVWTLDFGSIGLGIGASIGASDASRDRPTVLVMGDGGFAMSFGELLTAQRLGLPLLVVVLNDSGYGAEYDKLTNLGWETDLAEFDWPVLASVAAGVGCQSVRASTNAEVAAAWKSWDQRRGPMVLEVMCDMRDPFGDLRTASA